MQTADATTIVSLISQNPLLFLVIIPAFLGVFFRRFFEPFKKFYIVGVALAYSYYAYSQGDINTITQYIPQLEPVASIAPYMLDLIKIVFFVLPTFAITVAVQSITISLSTWLSKKFFKEELEKIQLELSKPRITPPPPPPPPQSQQPMPEYYPTYSEQYSYYPPQEEYYEVPVKEGIWQRVKKKILGG